MIGVLDWKDEEVQASIMNSLLNIILRFLPHFHGAVTIEDINTWFSDFNTLQCYV
jgi:hypothetical protein